MARPACVDLRSRIDLVDPVRAVVMERLRCFSPEVERAEAPDGVYWLDAEGLDCLYPSLDDWADRIRADLETLGFDAVVVVVGFTRFGTFALARVARGNTVFEREADEAAACGRVPLSCLNISEAARRGLARLNKRTVADLLTLPPGGVMERFGPELQYLHRLASKSAWDPLRPEPAEPPVVEQLELDYPETDAARITFYIKRLLRPLLRQVRDRYHALKDLVVTLEIAHADDSVQHITPAEPTLDEMQLIDLVRLRLEQLTLKEGAVAVTLEAVTVPATSEQLEMFQKTPRRDLKAADRALARLVAELGEGTVVRAVLKQGHLPEARFTLEPLRHVPPPRLEPSSPSPNAGRPVLAETPPSEPAPPPGTLVRRIFSKPKRLQKKPVVGPRGCHLKGMANAPATRLTGPYTISGGWWVKAVHREYYFAETETGEILWIYYDKRRRCWFWHGEV